MNCFLSGLFTTSLKKKFEVVVLALATRKHCTASKMNVFYPTPFPSSSVLIYFVIICLANIS